MRFGLTGGIASGKSAVADCFEALGIPVIDADQVAREVVEPGREALEEIVGAFGSDILDAKGRLDRRRLRQRIFGDAQQRKRLEQILHPRIRQRMDQLAVGQEAPYVILAIPLLLETGQYRKMDRVLVIDCPESLQLERVCQRDEVSEDEARAILQAQSNRNARRAIADDIIENSGTLESLQQQVEALHRKYLQLAAGEVGSRPRTQD